MSLILDIGGFLLLLFVGLYLPGRLLLSLVKVKTDSLVQLFLPFTIGLLLFTLTGYLLAWVHLPFLLLPLCLIVSLVSIVKQKLSFPRIERKHMLPLFLTFGMALVFASVSFPTGFFGTTLFYRHDDLWHLMLVNEMLYRFPPNNPGFSAIPLHGYHFFYDFLLSLASKYFFVSVNGLYFRFFPLLLSFLWAMGVYCLTFVWSKKISVALWSVFFTIFGGSFGYGLLLQGHKGFSMDSGLGISQPFSSLFNPPFTISLILLVTGLLSLWYFYTTKKTGWLVLFILTAGLTPMFKVYAGILLMGSYVLLVITELLKRNTKILWTIPFIAALFFGTYWIFASGSGYLIWYPLWSPTTILQSFPWYNYDNKIYVYSQLHVIRGLIQTEVDGLTIFFLGNLGTRLFGLLLLGYFWLRKDRKISLFTLHVIFLALVAIVIPLFFIQSGKVFEIIQMGWYFLFLAAIGAGFGCAYFFEQEFSNILKVFLLIGIIALTLPSAYEAFTGINQTLTYNPQKDRAIAFLAKDKNYAHTVLELPSGDVSQWYMHQLPTVATFGQKQAYVANEFIDFPGVSINERLHDIALVATNSGTMTSDFLKKNNITYMYSLLPNDILLGIPGVKKVFSDVSGSVYKVE